MEATLETGPLEIQRVLSPVSLQCGHHGVSIIFCLKESLTKLYVKHNTAGKTYEDFERDMDRDFFMSAEEAVAYGLADEIIEKRPQCGKS